MIAGSPASSGSARAVAGRCAPNQAARADTPALVRQEGLRAVLPDRHAGLARHRYEHRDDRDERLDLEAAQRAKPRAPHEVDVDRLVQRWPDAARAGGRSCSGAPSQKRAVRIPDRPGCDRGDVIAGISPIRFCILSEWRMKFNPLLILPLMGKMRFHPRQVRSAPVAPTAARLLQAPRPRHRGPKDLPTTDATWAF